MAKTRSQTGKIAIKKEEEEDRKPTIGLRSITMTTRGKITKRKPCKGNNRRLPAQQVKMEENTDTKSLLQSSPKYSKRQKGQGVSQEQINQLIDAIVNDKMGIATAARKVKMAYSAAYNYYNQYNNNPEKKIPPPRNRQMYITQEHIVNLIRHIVDDKMFIKDASAKANISCKCGRYYYKKYLKDPDRNIPIPYQKYTQDQENKFIGYIVNDKMSITAASKKAKMNNNAGRTCYREYFTDQTPNIATPSHIARYNHYTQEQIKEVISHIIDGKMSIRAASKKANMSLQAATKHYRRYLKDNNLEIPVSKYRKQVTQDRVDELMGYIVDYKMAIKAASKKANMGYTTALKYYRQYLKAHNLDLPAIKDRLNQLIHYIIDDNMSIYAASKKAHVDNKTGKKYYHQYLKNQKCDAPTQRGRVVSASKNEQ